VTFEGRRAFFAFLVGGSAGGAATGSSGAGLPLATASRKDA
jgi:hypothetical protein